MDTQFASTTEIPEVRSRPSARAVVLLSLGPATILAGVLWAFFQPWRMTILHPRGEGFWWLVVEPPLLVAAAGIVFHLLVAKPLVDDLEEGR